MKRAPHYLSLAAAVAGVVAVLVHPVLAETTQPVRPHRVHHAAKAMPQQPAEGAFTGMFGAYLDAKAAAHSAPAERRYFGSASRQTLADADPGDRAALVSLAAQHASANGIPVSLVHRVIMRESRYNPQAVNAGNYGIMQIRLGTARAMGYTGSAAGLLDADTNMIYAVKYLAGAYRAAHGNENLAVALYARGYGRVN